MNFYSQNKNTNHCKKYHDLLLFLLFFNYQLASISSSFAQENLISNQEKPMAEAESPYLQAHADNPVIWYEWGTEALEKAKRENKPLIISIGYTACHWCHVMEAETFMDTTVAGIMNAHFVPVKIDREQRPDLDKIYVEASLRMTGTYGWPLNVLATSDGAPFHAVTYQSRSQWIQLLNTYQNLYLKSPDRLKQNAAAVTTKINVYKQNQVLPSINDEIYRQIFTGLRSSIDQHNGGFRQMQKFPLPVAWQSILQYAYLTGDQNASRAIDRTLDIMASRAINDHLEGGFFRYTTDAYWIKPHFEKMLYDNAQVISLYANAFRYTGNERYLKIMEETIEFADNWLKSDQGGFSSAVSAYHEENEDTYYTWTTEELESAISNTKFGQQILYFYNIKPEGNRQNNQNLLYTDGEVERFAIEQQLDPEVFVQNVKLFRQQLRQIRSARKTPVVDKKIVVSWNSLMIIGLVDAYLAGNNPDYLNLAVQTAEFLIKKARHKSGKISHIIYDGQKQQQSFLEDYSFTAAAFIRIYQATFEIKWLEAAKSLTDYAIDHYKSIVHPFFDYVSDEETLPVAPPVDLKDEVIPSSNSMMAKVLYELGIYYQEQKYLNLSQQMLLSIGNRITARKPEYGNWWMLMGMMANPPFEVVIMGPEALQKSLEMQQEYLPNVIVMGGISEALPLMKNKLPGDETRIYVCQNKVCKMPTHEVSEALKQIRNE